MSQTIAIEVRSGRVVGKRRLTPTEIDRHERRQGIRPKPAKRWPDFIQAPPYTANWSACCTCPAIGNAGCNKPHCRDLDGDAPNHARLLSAIMSGTECPRDRHAPPEDRT